MKSPKQAPTPEEVMEMGRNWLKAQVARLPLEERLEGLKPEEVLNLYAPQERLKGLKPEEVLDQFDPAQIEEYLRQSKRKKARSKNT